ncbi:hypothetical protein S7711_08116 [Stachybotrys chartarum IBT 7711]|uniref:Zn(2)-C6 fungal-type domain-containing protein n=1 Tax=Stachybotrys chartarum (strain CBS 109288 / IBT 7711) TaxID=1280523 RepID=A0A084AVM9_STACB|nr:hypothetical protein S7711_08116 [Stachybotrys chartarum IBT 7711]
MEQQPQDSSLVEPLSPSPSAASVPETATQGSVSSGPTRACHACNGRKIKCDRREPCSSCARLGKMCVYPPSGRIRRTKRAIMADMGHRILSLEKSLAQASSVSTPNKLGQPPPPRSPLEEASATLSTRDVLLQQGSSSQYFNEAFISRVICEEKDMKSAVSTPQEQRPYCSPFNALGVLSARALDQPPHSNHPPTQVAVKLWNHFKECVDTACNACLLHMPTDEVKVYSVIQDPAKASYENLALCFAIYFTTVASLTEEDAKILLGRDRTAALFLFKDGLEQSFAYADFLDCPTVTLLNALSTYISALRIHNSSKGIWILNGLALRIAQSIGLHRDGERLGLPPFEAERNRRMWWQLICREARAGEDYGLQSTKELSLPASDTRIPLNVDDSDLYPGMERLPPERKTWTRMTFFRVKVDLFEAQKKLLGCPGSCKDFPSEAERASIMKDVTERVETRLKHSNPVIPQQLLTMTCARHVLRKLDFISRLEWHSRQPSGSREDFATNENLNEAIMILKVMDMSVHEILKQYAWVKSAYPQNHLLAYILWHLCVKPEGPHVEEAWDTIEHDFGSVFTGYRGHDSKFAVLKALKAKAEAVRVKARNKAAASTRENQVGVSGDQQSPLQHDDGGYALFSDIGTESWTDWSAFNQNIQVNEQAYATVFWQ